MKLLKLSLRTRIFISMTLLVLLASILIAAVTIYQYKEEAEDYHQERLRRKENRIQIAINNALKSTTYPVNEENVPLIFRERQRIYQISEEHSLPINNYGLSVKLLIKYENPIEVRIERMVARIDPGLTNGIRFLSVGPYL